MRGVRLEWLLELLPLGLVAAASGGLVAALAPLSPAIPAPPLLAYGVAFSAVTASLIAAAVVTPVPGGRALVTALALSSAGIAGVAAARAGPDDPWGAAAVTACLLVAGAAVGSAVGGRVERAGHLLVVVVVSVLVDTFSVFHSFGPTAAAVARPRLIALIALPWPVLGTTEVAPVLGVGDVAFAALYLAAARRHELGVRRMALAVALGLVATAALVVVTGRPVPALLAMGAAVLALHPRARRLPAEDRRTGWTVIAGLGLLWLALWLFR